MEVIEAHLLSKLEQKLLKFKNCHLTLAARIMVANCLIQSCLWYMLYMWAGDSKFLALLQRKVDLFIWGGRSRVSKAVASLPKSEGGIGLICIADQHRAITGSLMLWVARPDDHPLRAILQQHVRHLSWKRWGLNDLSWLVSPCGQLQGKGSATWNSICRTWCGLKKLIGATKPVNVEEWRSLPLWRPHFNHQQRGNTKHLSKAQQTMCNLGIVNMGDVLDIGGQFFSWEQMANRGLPPNCRGAYLALFNSLVQAPALDSSQDLCEFFVEDRVQRRAWQFLVTPQQKQTGWLPFLDRNTAKRTFRISGDLLIPAPLSFPGPNTIVQRIIVQAPRGKSQLINCGPWNAESAMLGQYKWISGLPLLNSSTATIRRVQNRMAASTHSALKKWEDTLGHRIPDNIWDDTWQPYRSAKESTFLWQVAYRAIATQGWRYPNCPHTDPRTHCTRCDLAQKEDVLHCLWLCPASLVCWRWCEVVLALAAETVVTRIQLQPENVLIAVWLPHGWNVPARLWQILRAVLCWLIWKDRNNCMFTAQRPEPEAVIRKTWHRLSTYIRLEWQSLFRRVKLRQMSRDEAKAAMALMFGYEGILWNLEDFVIQVPPCPPRPP